MKKPEEIKEESSSECSSTSDEDVNYILNHPLNLKKIPENIDDNELLEALSHLKYDDNPEEKGDGEDDPLAGKKASKSLRIKAEENKKKRASSVGSAAGAEVASSSNAAAQAQRDGFLARVRALTSAAGSSVAESPSKKARDD